MEGPPKELAARPPPPAGSRRFAAAEISSCQGTSLPLTSRASLNWEPIRRSDSARNGAELPRGRSLVMGKEPTDLLRYSHLGFQFALILVGFIFGGHQLDRRLSTGGIITLLGTFVGAGV